MPIMSYSCPKRVGRQCAKNATAFQDCNNRSSVCQHTFALCLRVVIRLICCPILIFASNSAASIAGRDREFKNCPRAAAGSFFSPRARARLHPISPHSHSHPVTAPLHSSARTHAVVQQQSTSTHVRPRRRRSPQRRRCCTACRQQAPATGSSSSSAQEAEAGEGAAAAAAALRRGGRDHGLHRREEADG